MLDKPLYDEPEELTPLKCESCLLTYNDIANWNSIDEIGLCEDCQKIA